MSTDQCDVLIVGAGPTGLLLAGDLAAAGVSCTVLERRDRESNLTRAFAVHARTLEVFDARGVAEELLATGVTVDTLRLFDQVRINLSELPGRFPFLLITPQYHTERVLQRRATVLGAEIARGCTVVHLSQDTDSVNVRVQTEDGGVHTRRARYLVGADGAHSTVRRSIGLPFPGESAVQSVMLADVRLSQTPDEPLIVEAVADGFAFIVPYGDGWYRVIGWDRRHQLPDDAPVELDELRDITRRALGSDYGMHDPRWMSRFHSDERQSPLYRVDRVFLAGDAAHVHSPAGGQGMNTGLQDAANLGWKLAAAAHGWAPPGLLDTYQAERYPVGRRVLWGSGVLLRAAMFRSRAARAARRLVAGTLTRIPAINRRIAGAVSGIDVSYPAARGAHRSAGHRALDVALADGRRLHEALDGARFVLLGTVIDGLDGWADRVEPAVAAEAGPAALTLIRPDGYVAWASDDPAGPRRADALRATLTAWCGNPGEARCTSF
ncbi:2-polyprenyl-6-methoxyphenol hydroxylase [Nitrosomonas sp. Nm51]|uniref:FAD-dependent monooxygenase n=1 Tax=Nitrosomonas sp. Nm51 TaxID=133720 RepID=UPI0008BD5FB9|nr:FAD-dependent monooxygenase [Nitrosomonas sp. Nm51]SER46852.1 2-polyprenyl-6-methoxyphenol hydroxylase [Nitrosomonas sp. Nm51]